MLISTKKKKKNNNNNKTHANAIRGKFKEIIIFCLFINGWKKDLWFISLGIGNSELYLSIWKKKNNNNNFTSKN